jgi:acetyltransferase-like isoleucine patch superfamily enzyme
LYVRENVRYGTDLRVGRDCVVSSPHGLEIGNHVSIGPHTIIQVNGSIGDFALIGMRVQIVGRDDHASQVGLPFVLSTPVHERAATNRDSVRVGRDVWIGGGSVVLSGVSIGEGAVIGAGSVVTKDIPPYSIAVGNPARVVASRFSEPQQAEHSAALALRLAGGDAAQDLDSDNF